MLHVKVALLRTFDTVRPTHVFHHKECITGNQIKNILFAHLLISNINMRHFKEGTLTHDSWKVG